MSDLIRFRLEMSQDDLALEQEKADDGLIIESVSPLEVSTPSGLEEGRFVETVIVIVTTTLAVIAERVAQHWLKSKEEGIQIDTRTIPPTLSIIANVPRGFAVVIDKDGHAKPYKFEYDKGDTLATILDLALKNG